MTDTPTPTPQTPEEGMTAVNYEHMPNFVNVLQQLKVSLLVSTYQAGKVVGMGVHDNKLDISFFNFDQAMGMAVRPNCIAVGTRRQVWYLRAAHDLGPRVDPVGKHDACFLTRSAHFTGAIHGHEMAWGGEKLWIVNTLFSCVCTIEPEFSFVPRWKPPFISNLASEDRCHLNGLAMEGNEPRYVTVMAETDTPGGWRPDKATTGCILDVKSNEVVARGFAMPHSPRLHEGQLYVLDSGHGRMSHVDLATGKAEPIVHVPGYTRGVALHGPYAFIGMSRIRETSVFGGIPIAEHRDKLQCGVSIVDIRNGQLVSQLAFRSGVEEIFDVKVLPGVRCPAYSGPLPDRDGTKTIWLAPPLG